MTSFSFDNPEGMLDSPDKQNNPQTEKKNHWIFKLCAHIIIISLLLSMLIIIHAFDIIVVPLSIWLGRMIQTNKLIIKGSNRIFFILFTGMMIFYAYILVWLAIQMDMYHISSWIESINNWFSGIPWTFFYLSFQQNYFADEIQRKHWLLLEYN